jgi:ketosteroid isomerase-like protein
MREDIMATDRGPTSAEYLARAYLTALQAKDKPKLLSLFADDFALVVPLNVSGTNDYKESWYGIKAAEVNYGIVFKTIEIMKFLDPEITPGQDPSVAFAEVRGVMTMANGRPYENIYVLRFDAADGKIKRIREYVNPVTGAIAFGYPLPHVADDGGPRFINDHPKH